MGGRGEEGGYEIVRMDLPGGSCLDQMPRTQRLDLHNWIMFMAPRAAKRSEESHELDYISSRVIIFYTGIARPELRSDLQL